ncbi:hypothetical protein MLD38_029976 [Melastoma candidum]|uniref:Uncharacterized protein n=1 Tax=Melastoma candidum TaxID=119954 RepID=A0ACB9MMC0_9MYRT|nr:hypothetical protein MLD38_029976 [Melastoma candidum]
MAMAMDPCGIASGIRKSGEDTNQMWNKLVVETLYESLALRDTETVEKLLAGDLEWWFHGPPGSQHMMRVLTGESDYSRFEFRPRRVTPIWGCVIAEGWEGDEAYWVHVWTVEDGTIVKFHEYFDTWLTVRDMRSLPGWGRTGRARGTLWQSQPRYGFDRSLPGLLFAM